MLFRITIDSLQEEWQVLRQLTARARHAAEGDAIDKAAGDSCGLTGDTGDTFVWCGRRNQKDQRQAGLDSCRPQLDGLFGWQIGDNQPADAVGHGVLAETLDAIG